MTSYKSTPALHLKDSMAKSVMSVSISNVLLQARSPRFHTEPKPSLCESLSCAAHCLASLHRGRREARLCSSHDSESGALKHASLQPIVPPSQAEAFQDLVQNPQDYRDLRPLKRNTQSPGSFCCPSFAYCVCDRDYLRIIQCYRAYE